MPLLLNDDDIGDAKKLLGDIQLLTREEEQQLGETISKHWVQFVDKQGNLIKPTDPELLRQFEIGLKARDRFVRQNIRLVISIAGKYLNRGVSFNDLINAGSLGLIRAAEKFDYTKGYKFSTYAYWWVRQAITREIATKSRNIRLPVHITEKLNKLKKTRSKLSQQHNRKATRVELAEALDITLIQLDELLTWEPHTASLDAFRKSDDDDSDTVLSFIPDNTPSPLDRPDPATCRQLADKCLRGLSARSRQAYIWHYQDGITKADIARRLGVSENRAKSLIARARDQVRRNKSKYLDEIKEVLA